MLTFLEINGVSVRAPDPELADWILGLGADGTPKQLAQHIDSILRQ